MKEEQVTEENCITWTSSKITSISGINSRRGLVGYVKLLLLMLSLTRLYVI
jgi:hypothetical protein